LTATRIGARRRRWFLVPIALVVTWYGVAWVRHGPPIGWDRHDRPSRGIVPWDAAGRIVFAWWGALASPAADAVIKAYGADGIFVDDVRALD
jgi:hypothetical protein